MSNASQIAADFAAEVDSLQVRNTASVRRLRRRLSASLSNERPSLVFQVASELIGEFGQRWVAYEVIANHKGSYLLLDDRVVAELGSGLDSWYTVDAFARILAGPAWRDGLIGDATISRWAQSDDRWWRRAALVSTVALNVRSHGGTGDAERTLAVCRMLVTETDDMVVKALSWALRELVVHDPGIVAEFLDEHEEQLPTRVKREVRSKLETGLKYQRNPKA
ncbi:MAG: DNA alkylation repair protein [Chloroflexi bacterium]|nr:DNA alkylation repair protein [Chloroflexota bacterium]